MVDPIKEFLKIFESAKRSGINKPEAAFLATASPDGAPSGRVVLFKGVQDGKLLFFTNYNSRKGKNLSENPKASMVFWWDILGRQVRFEGTVERTDSKTSDEYWNSRPVDSNLSASVSNQSHPIESHETLIKEVEELKVLLNKSKPARPEHWGGYTLIPKTIEFWQDRPNRLHIRQLFTRNGENWEKVYLQP